MNKDVFQERPNNTVIEMTSVSKLKDALIRTELMVPDIPDTDDKVPSWDGEVRLYSSRENFKKDTMLERVPVQVKGIWVKRFSKTRATFQADASDLRNYLNDGGIMFFLIQIKNFDEYKIYYASLLPFDLRRMLDEVGNHKTKAIKLDIFPHKYKDGIIRIFEDYRTNKKRQAMLLPTVRSLSDLESSQMEIERLEFSVPQNGLTSQEDMLQEMLCRPLYIYAKPKNVDASFAIDKVYPEQIVEHRNNPVQVNDELLYDHIDVVRQPNKKKLYKFGTDVTISIDKAVFNLSCSFRGSLKEQIKETKLILALLKKQPVIVGGKVLPIDFTLDFHGHTEDEASNRLSALLRIEETLRMLHINKDLNLGDLSSKDLQELNCLVSGIVDHRPVPFSINGKAGFGKLTIGNLTILLTTKNNPAGDGFLLSDFFSVDDLILTADKAPLEDGCNISPYSLLTAGVFDTIDNFCLSEIVTSIRKFPYTPLYGETVVLFTLELLKLFDRKRDFSILDIVINLIDFIQENDSSHDEMNNVNRLQTEKRRRKLTKEEKQYLISMKLSGIPLQYQLAANILLESFQEAQIIYDSLSDNERKMFDTFPINNLWIKCP